MSSKNYVTRVDEDIANIPASAWDALLARQTEPTPFMRHAYLEAATRSGSATGQTGWQPLVLSLWQDGTLAAATALYAKNHSYGEYVFDWAWAQAYEQHGLSYYPKLLGAVPFTPVPGTRLLAQDEAARTALVNAALGLAQRSGVSSLHILYPSPADRQALQAAGFMIRTNVQFHWSRPPGVNTFDDYLATLEQNKRKKIRAERRKVAEAGVHFRALVGAQITDADWAFFYRCYSRTYHEHGNPPYLTPGFFRAMAQQMPEHWLLLVAQREDQDIACSLIGLAPSRQRAYGRYWGALERVDCLHFEACYYQPLAWCIEHGYTAFEGGAQGEHKMARGLLPVATCSAHWLAHPQFADAVQRFLDREGRGIDAYVDELRDRNPFRSTPPSGG
jgi:predicted N-acyltransferase